MKDLIEKIYSDVLVYEEEIVKTNREVDEEIRLLVEPYQNQLNQEELEELKGLLSSISLTAEKTGFKNGVRLMIRFLIEQLID